MVKNKMRLDRSFGSTAVKGISNLSLQKNKVDNCINQSKSDYKYNNCKITKFNRDQCNQLIISLLHN